MTRPATADEIADRERDYRKHDRRPGDPPSPINAVEIAVLVKGMKNITEAAKLIDDYAACVAAGARLEGVELVSRRIDRVFDEAAR